MERRAQAAEALMPRSQGQDALDNAIRAAELYMEAAAKATNKQEATRLRRRCNELIAYAERLKSSLVPRLSPAQEIIHGASRLHGNDFPPWQEPNDAEFQTPSSGGLYIDEATFTLPKAQTATFSGWLRPKELFEVAEDAIANNSNDDPDSTVFMGAEKPCDLVQDATTDCSVVAGLSAAINVLVGKPKVLSSIIHPFDHNRDRPKFSSSGKYVLRMNFNGCLRRVVIDDRLPASSTDRNLFVVDRANTRLLWPALLEKAYLKVRGGYDFPGSNSGTDLWVLTGWIPEQVFLQRDDLDINQVWSRIKTAHDSQDVVITIGTGGISPEEERITGLIGEHDYAVQSLDEVGGIRKLLVKNPWSYGPTWKGAWTSAQPCEHEDSAAGARGEHTDSLVPNTVEGEPEGGGVNLSCSGCLWVTLEDVAQNFESMYLNWNPRLFPHRQDYHFKWATAAGRFAPSVVRNPQFSITSPHGGLVWVLVCRHFVDAELEIARRRTDSMAAASRQLGFMSILVFDSDGKRVQVADGETYRGPYVDSPQTLARLDTSAGRSYTIVLDQHELPLSEYTLTLSTFSNSPAKVHEAVEPMSNSQELLGAWDRRTAGGNATYSTYFLNPQYSISVPEPTPLSVLLSTDNREVPVHVDLVWAHGRRAINVRMRDILTSSGEYRRGCAVAEASNVEPGDYTIVCSTFEAGQAAGFGLRVTSMVPVSVEPIPANAAGRLQTSLAPFSLSSRTDKVRAPLSVEWLTRASACVYIRASARQHHGGRPASNPLIRLSIISGRGPHLITIAESGNGDFQEPSMPLRTSEFDLEPGRVRSEGMWLLVEGIGVQGDTPTLNGEIFSDSPVYIGAWEIVDTL